MGDNKAFLRLCRMAEGMVEETGVYCGPAGKPPQSDNVTVDCEFCYRPFVTSKGCTDGCCPSCGAPMRKGPRKLPKEKS